LQTNTSGNGVGGNLVVSAPRIFLQDGARISTRGSDTGVGGNIFVNAADSIQLRGYSSIDPGLNTGIASLTNGSRKGGDIQVTTRRLRVKDGAVILTTSSGVSTAGNSIINAAEMIEVIGESPFTPSSLVTATINRGNAGQLYCKRVKYKLCHAERNVV
jgi:hypothetical protein